MPKSDDPKIPLDKETRKKLNLYKITNDFKSYQDAINNLLDKIEEKDGRFKKKNKTGN